MDHKIIRKPYSPEFRERAVRLFLEHRPEGRSGYLRVTSAIESVQQGERVLVGVEPVGPEPKAKRSWSKASA